ncbi:MAG TPA: hypothetical protein VGX03_02605 [Candidatus Binatia bacterium]|jgi:hypothetical protein|nr:hypothetical protein [Candidatus Binatia bacterium]
MSGTLIAHRGSVRIPKEELMLIEAPSPTKSWRPIQHGVLVNTLTEVLSSRGLEVRKEEYAIQRDGNVLFAVMDLFWGGTMDYYAALGLRTSNDKSFAIQIAIGARVTVCDNLLLSGELIALKRKHTAGLELIEELTAGIRRYELGYQQLGKGIERLKGVMLQTIEAREIVYNVFSQHVLPVKLFHPVAQSFSHHVVERKPITLWTMNNFFTDALKKLAPGAAFEANVKLGKFFALGNCSHNLSV